MPSEILEKKYPDISLHCIISVANFRLEERDSLDANFCKDHRDKIEVPDPASHC